MEKNIIYQLIGEDKPVGWQLPLKEVLIEKIGENGESEGLKKIKFVPGTQSFFAEDLAGQLKPVSIWFDRGQLVVPKVDKVKNALLQAHPWFNLKYEIYSKEMANKRELDALRVKGEARKLIDDSDAEKLHAIALAIFGAAAFSWGPSTSELELLKYAERNPAALKRELDSSEYESKYLSALAFSKEIVKTNIGKSAIIWNDTTEGVILRLARGEKGIQKLGEFLSIRTTESEMVIQAIGERVEKLDTQVAKPSKKDVEAMKVKDDEIAALKAQLANIMDKVSANGESTTSAPPAEVPGPMTIETARKEYKKMFKKQVPVNKKNNLDWILNRLGQE